MTATLLSTQHFDHAHLRMPAGHSWEGQYGYDQSDHTGQASYYPAQLSQMPVHSLDFLDVSARSYPTPQASSSGISPTPTSLAASWHRETHGHARSTSESQISFDDFDDADEELQQPDTLQRWTSASSADPSSLKRKMKRFRLTHNQTRFLMNEFHREPHPDAAHREYLSQKIPGLSPRQVQVWFQNRRAKSKRVINDHDSITRSRLQNGKSDQSQSPGPGHSSTQSPPGAGTVQNLHVPGHPEIIRQPSAAELFAQTLSEQAIHASAAQCVTTLDTRQEKAPAPRAKRTRKRATTTLVFGREVTVWVDETDTGSENDEEDDSYDEEDDMISPTMSEPAHRTHYGFPAYSMASTGFEEAPLHSPAIDLDYYNLSPWGATQPPLSNALLAEAARRASMSSAAQQPSVDASLHRPPIMARPSWTGLVAGDDAEAQPGIGSVWYQTHRTAYDREE